MTPSDGQGPVESGGVGELLPCPFCGGEAVTSTYVTESLFSHDQVEYLSVGCSGDCDIVMSGEQQDEVRAAWNRRDPPKDNPVADGQSTAVVAEIAAERRRQVKVEGWAPEHDDKHDAGDLLTAAVCYAQRRMDESRFGIWTPTAPAAWPWDVCWWKPKDRRRDLIRAAALIVAEIERLDRLAAPSLDATGHARDGEAGQEVLGRRDGLGLAQPISTPLDERRCAPNRAILMQLPRLIQSNIQEVPGWSDNRELVTAYCHATVLHDDLPDAFAALEEQRDGFRETMDQRGDVMNKLFGLVGALGLALKEIARGELENGKCSVCGTPCGGVLVCDCEHARWEPRPAEEIARAALAEHDAAEGNSYCQRQAEAASAAEPTNPQPGANP